MNQSNLPRLLTVEQVAEYLEVSADTLTRWRAENTGPNFVKVGGGIRYMEGDVLEYLQSQRQLPSEAQKMQAAIRTGMAGVKEALKERREQLQALDKADHGEPDPYALTMSGVGQTPGEKIERHFNVPAQTFEAPAAPHIIQGR